MATNDGTTTRTDIPKKYGNFDLELGPIKDSASGVDVCSWRSRETGLKVVWADVPGPILSGYLTAATEITTDSGIPHTLEHLVFLGSEKYPYKGILDSLANRAFGNGTNAWTAVTHTAYTMSSAGEDGFLRLLPIFVDHLLYPTLTDSGYVTEVHHINGKGQDAGVVYSEMQGRQNGSGDLMELRRQRRLYPEGSGYRSETGGLMEKLRVLDVEQIRQYHRSTYLPHNFLLLITGTLSSPTTLLSTIQSTIESSILSHTPLSPPLGPPGPKPQGWKRPWIESGSHELEEKRKREEKEGKGELGLGGKGGVEVVEFPEEDESMGEVWKCWKGAGANDFLTTKAIDILATYLSDSSISPLFQKFVEIEEPYCTDITFLTTDNENTTIDLYLSSVPVEHVDGLSDKVDQALKEIVDKRIDMDRMKVMLKRERLKQINEMEEDASEQFASVIISDFLYGNVKGKDLENALRDMELYDEMNKWGAKEWEDLLRKWLINPECLTIIGKPSASLAHSLEEAEKARVEATRESLGESGLAQKAKELEEAQKQNDKTIPTEILEDFKIPPVDSIQFLKVNSARSGGVAKKWKDRGIQDVEFQKVVDGDGTELPYFIQFDQSNSKFIRITLHFFPSRIPPKLLPLFPIYLASFFSLPITRSKDGTKLSYQDVVASLDRETVDYDVYLGQGDLQEECRIFFKIEPENYSKAIEWIRDLIWGSEFDIERLKIEASKMSQNLPPEKRDGSSVVRGISRQMLFDEKKSGWRSMGLFDRESFLPELMERLKEEPEKVQEDLKKFRDGLTDLKTMRIGVAGPVEKLPEPVKSWERCFKHPQQDSNTTLDLEKPLLSKDTLTSLGKNPSKEAVVVSMRSIESSFAYHITKGPDDWEHEDVPALSVTLSVLNAMESFLWRYIRGEGLAYGARIYHSPESGTIRFDIYRSPDSATAFLAGKKLLQELVDGKVKIDQVTLDSSKSTLAYGTAAGESTMGEATMASFNNQVLKSLPRDYRKDRLSKAASVTIEDCLAMIKKWILPIFDPNTSIAAVASTTNKSDEIADRLQELGFKVERRTLDTSGGAGSGSSGSETGSETGSE